MKVIKLAKTVSTPKSSSNPDWKEMANLVECNYIQYIELPKLSKKVGFDVSMVCDDEGKLKSEIMYNGWGTALFWNEYGARDIIAGKVVLVKNVMTRDGIDTVSLSEDEVYRIKEVLKSMRNLKNSVSARMDFAGYTTF